MRQIAQVTNPLLDQIGGRQIFADLCGVQFLDLHLQRPLCRAGHLWADRFGGAVTAMVANFKRRSGVL